MLRDVRHALLVFACAVTVAVAGGTIGVQVVSAAAGQILKIVTSDDGGTFYVGRCFRTNFEIQTDNLQANSVDLIVPYNPSYLQPYSNSGCTTAATQITTHNLFPSYPSNSISGNQILVTGYDPSGNSPVNTGANPADRIMGYVFWKVMAASGSHVLRYTHTLGSTIDTNIAEDGGDGSDVLDAVENLTLNLSADATPPTFTNLYPTAGSGNVSVTSLITYLFSDAGAGIHSGSLVTRLNGTPQTLVKSGCTTTNSNRKPQCNISINPSTLSYNTLYTVTATGSDLALPNNTGSTTWTFTTEDDDDAPYVQNESPANSAVGVAVASNIQFNIKDFKNNAGVTPGLGVDTSTIQVTVTVGNNAPVTYDSGDAEFSISGIASNRTVVINPASDFPENTLITVTVNASDLHSPANVMSAHTYSFRTVDSAGPSISGYSPAQSAINVAADTNIVFTISDDGAGVDIANTTITVEGVVYDQSDPEFGFTGNSGSYTITFNPSSNFSGGQVVDVSISTRDLASPTPNTASASYSFTIASSCATCSVDGEDPDRFTTTATLDATIVFHVKDTGAGIDDDSIRVTLVGDGLTANPLILTGSSVLVDITGSASDYTVTVTLPSAIEQDTAYAILIDASDVNGLDMSTVAYTFMNLSGSGGGSCSSSSSAAACICSSDDGDGDTNQTRRPVPPLIQNLQSSELPQIVKDRRLPDSLHAAAPLTHYDDVHPGDWFERPVKDLLDRGVLDKTQNLFRPADFAVRAEFAKILVKLENILPRTPAEPAFDDTDRTAWYFAYTEEAGMQSWMKGDDNCYGTHPCTLRPGAPTTRAEAVAMLVRYYKLAPLSLAPVFADVGGDAWYRDVLQIAADRCIVQGDDLTGLAEPERIVNRAEMIAMFSRAEQHLRYGKDCGTVSAGPQASLLADRSGALSQVLVYSLLSAVSGMFGWAAARRPRNV